MTLPVRDILGSPSSAAFGTAASVAQTASAASVAVPATDRGISAFGKASGISAFGKASGVAGPATASGVAGPATASGVAAAAGRHRRVFDRVAFACLAALAVSFGFGDVRPQSPFAAVHVLVPIAIGVSLVAALQTRARRGFPSQLALPVAVWLLVLAASAILAPRFQREALDTLARPAGGILLAWSVYAVCTRRARVANLARALALGGLVVALFGLAEASGNEAITTWLDSLHDGSIPLGDVPRVAATLSHPNVAAALLELCLPLLVAWTWTARPAWRLALATATLACLLALVLTFSRAGIVAALVGLGVMSGLSLRSRQRGPALGIALMTLVLPVALLWAGMADDGLGRRLTAGLETASQTSPSRLEYWSAAARMAADHPLLGVGPDNYRWSFTEYAGIPVDNLGVHAHNQYLEALADTGFLGLLAFGWLLVAMIGAIGADVLNRQTRLDPWRLALLGSLSAWLGHGLLDDFERFWPSSVVFWLVLGLGLAIRAIDGQLVQQSDQALGRVALGGKLHPRRQRLAAVLGSTAERDDGARRCSDAQPVELARRQARQVPVEQHHLGPGAHDGIDQAAAAGALRHD